MYEKRLSENINFAVLVSMHFTELFGEPLRYAEIVSRMANLFFGGGNVLVQRLGDLRVGRRSKPEKIANGLVEPEPTLRDATPGELNLALPYRHLTDIDVFAKIAGENSLVFY